MMSRSTDRNLDNLGLDDDDEDEDDIEDDEEDDEEIFADRRSDPEALSLLTRQVTKKNLLLFVFLLKFKFLNPGNRLMVKKSPNLSNRQCISSRGRVPSATCFPHPWVLPAEAEVVTVQSRRLTVEARQPASAATTPVS